MTNGGLLEAPIVTDYPNRLATTSTPPSGVVRRPWLAVGLLVLCLLPRGILACRTVGLCPDATLYITLARALEKGELKHGLQEMGWNTYPVLLMLLHRTGLDWETTGKWWGVLASSLVVLPMFGFLRRQFDDRVAVAGCVLYAVHANVIEWTPEVLRDQTFWFLFMLAVYLLWRAVTEVRWGLFLAAGLATTLAVFTRFEGLFLLIPLGCWSVARWCAWPAIRAKLTAGVLLVLGFCPAVLVALNLTLLGGESWTLLRLKPLEVAWAWVVGRGVSEKPSPGSARPPSPSSSPRPPVSSPEASAASEPTPAMAAEAQKLAAVSAATATRLLTPPPRLPLPRLIWAYLNEIERGLTVVFGLPLLVGLWRCRRLLLRADLLPAALLSLTVLGSMWIHLWFTQTKCFRYPITIVLATSGFAGLGLLAMTFALKQAALRRRWPAGRRYVATALPLVLIAGIGLADALTKNYQRRIEYMELGRWLSAECEVSRVLVSPDSSLRVVAYYAAADCIAFPEFATVENLRETTRALQPGAVLLSRRQVQPEQLDAALRRLEPLGYRLVSQTEQPWGVDSVWVVARPGCQTRPARYVARRPR